MGSQAAFAVALLNYALVAWLIVSLVYYQRRESTATWAWIFFLLLVPYLGVVAFWLLGSNRLRFRRWRRRRLKAGASSIALRPTAPLPTGCPFPADPGLLELAERLDGVNARPWNAVTLYREGEATFAAIEEAIDSAHDHVHLTYYIWRPDRTGKRLRDALVRAARRGVAVRLLLDDVGCLGTPQAFFAPLAAAGGQIVRFLPLSRLGRRLSLNHRNHRKIVVVDGAAGFTGGMNVGDEYAGLQGPWLDAHVRVRGPAVQRLQEIFCEDWYHTTGEDLGADRYFPPPSTAGEEWVQFVASGPTTDRWHAIHTILFAAINRAQRRVWLETPYFVPDVAMALSLETAALRGVDVRLVLPGRSDHQVVLYAGRSFYARLLAAGVRIYEVPKGFLHAKTATIDGRVATVGSANLDQRSFRLNFEANAFFYGPTVAGALEASFERILERAREVDRAAHRRRPRRQRALEAVARLLSPVL
ncbi:MAG: cardiolipin synthase [Planctomycetota bacterium]|nr:MAG: cardiolipin synthase [Planctomycetota bacterium]